MSKPEGSGVGIVGMGVFLPDTIRRNDWWPPSWGEKKGRGTDRDVVGTVDKAAHRRSAEVDPEVARHAGPYYEDPFRGVKERRIMDPGMWPSDMEIGAGRAALDDAGVEPGEVDLLMGYSMVRDYAIVGNPAKVADALGVPRTAAVFELGGGCQSFLPLLQVATRLIQAGQASTALVYCGSAQTRMTDWSQPSSVLVGDGAVAAVVRRVEPGEGYVDESTLHRGDWHGGVQAAPKDRPEVPWFDFDDYEGPLVVQRIDREAAHCMGSGAASIFREVATPLFEKAGCGPEDVDFLCVSQVGAWFGPAMCEAIGLDPATQTLPPEDHFERFGHCMPASMPLNLFLAHRLGRLALGDLVLMFAPGAGFSASAALYRWNLPPR